MLISCHLETDFCFFSNLDSLNSFSPPLIDAARNSRTMLNSSGKSGHPCLVPDLKRNACSFSPLIIMFAVGLSYIAFIILSLVPSAHFLEFLS